MGKIAQRKQAQFCLLAPKKRDVRKGLLEDLSGLSVEVVDSVTDSGLRSADVIMPYVKDEQWGKEAVKELRSRPEFFLKPLLILSERPLEQVTDVVDDVLVLPVQQD
ncbi:MAG: hypothetical protein J3T61_09030, partial [Candidatus Brocadiales bacterium]|nr:hypothetical protein [Candidatus Bathyanammoxibius sp.]